jgi:hypothetical protein
MRVPGLSRHSSVSLNKAITQRAGTEQTPRPHRSSQRCATVQPHARIRRPRSQHRLQQLRVLRVVRQRAERRGYNGSFRGVGLGHRLRRVKSLLVTGGISLFRVEIEREHGCGREVEVVEIRSLRCRTVSREQQSQLKLSDVNQPRRVSQPRLLHLMGHPACKHAACNMRHDTANRIQQASCHGGALDLAHRQPRSCGSR